MISTIKKGKHRGKPISFGLWYNRKIIERNVSFNPDCRYLLEGEDALAVVTAADRFGICTFVVAVSHNNTLDR